MKTQNNRGVGAHLETDAHRAATICPQPGASSVKTTLSVAMFREATAVRASSSRLADAVTVKNVLHAAHVRRKMYEVIIGLFRCSQVDTTSLQKAVKKKNVVKIY